MNTISLVGETWAYSHSIRRILCAAKVLFLLVLPACNTLPTKVSITIITTEVQWRIHPTINDNPVYWGWRTYWYNPVVTSAWDLCILIQAAKTNPIPMNVIHAPITTPGHPKMKKCLVTWSGPSPGI